MALLSTLKGFVSAVASCAFAVPAANSTVSTVIAVVRLPNMLLT
jgi:hypothetical protein